MKLGQMDTNRGKSYFRALMPDPTPNTSTLSFAVWANAFSPEEMDAIEACGDGLTAQKAGLVNGRPEGEQRDEIRITRTAWIMPGPQTQWIYDRMQVVSAALNEQVYQFDLSGFSENFQYTVYYADERGHYDWHVDQGLLKTQRKLSMTLQLTDPSQYDGCDLQFYAGNKIDTAPRDRGSVIAFPAFVVHRVTPCTRGTRKSVVVWTTGPKFR